MKIDDNTPYIVVDNRKIAPIRRITHKDPLAHGRQSADERPFGVVDRVTISKAAREKLRQMESSEDNDAAAKTLPNEKSETLVLPFFSTPPKRNS